MPRPAQMRGRQQCAACLAATVAPVDMQNSAAARRPVFRQTPMRRVARGGHAPGLSIPAGDDSMTLKPLFLAAVAALSCSAQAQTAPLKVGLMLPATGTFAALGDAIEKGFKLYVQEQGG